MKARKLFLGLATLEIIISLIIPTSYVHAAELPNAYWSLNDRYNAAVNANDYYATIDSGTQIINLMLNQPETDQTKSILGTKLYGVAFASYFVGDYDNAAKYFEMYIPYGQYKGWTDGVIIADTYAKELPSTLDVYQSVPQPQKVYGVKNEPTGVLIGEVMEKSKSDDSMMLVYVEYGDLYFDYVRNRLQVARENHQSVELALNFPHEAYTVRSISASDWFLSEFHDFLSDFRDIPIYLRIGAEFNVWTDKCEPQEFINAYITVANSVSDMPNISWVWSSSYASTWPNSYWPYTVNDFYPGDAYVDWVGVNCYAKKYFEGKVYTGQDRCVEAFYKTGDFADPVRMISDIVKTYGDRKPIMIVESGSEYQVNSPYIYETHEDWAAKKLKEMYSFIPIVYPQVKLMAYFNKKTDNEINYYDLDGSYSLSAAYNDMKASPWFIHGGGNSADAHFSRLSDSVGTDGTISLYSYPHIVGADNITVSYYLDGMLAAQTSEIPYRADLGGITGSKKLTVTAEGSNGLSVSREYLLSGPGTALAMPVDETAGLTKLQKDAIEYVTDRGLMEGYDDNSLRLENTITRGEFAAMVCRMMGYNANKPCTFSDTAEHWASMYVQACVEANAISGVGDNKFAPDNKITFEQAVKIITIVSGYAYGYESYPDGFINIADREYLLDGLLTTSIGVPMTRLDVAMLMYNAVKQ